MIIDIFGIEENDQKIVDRLLVDGPLNFYYNSCSTSYRFPFMSHILANRNEHVTEEVSQYYQIFYGILKKFADKHGMFVNQILRACINGTCPDDRFEMLDPHVDQDRAHFVCIMYLNDLTTPPEDPAGSTILFDQTFPDAGLPECCDVADPEVMKNFTIAHEIHPQKGTILCFGGSIYHTIRPPKNGDYRFVAVFNFI